jgi:hypothetical protein
MFPYKKILTLSLLALSVGAFAEPVEVPNKDMPTLSCQTELLVGGDLQNLGEASAKITRGSDSKLRATIVAPDGKKTETDVVLTRIDSDAENIQYKLGEFVDNAGLEAFYNIIGTEVRHISKIVKEEHYLLGGDSPNDLAWIRVLRDRDNQIVSTYVTVKIRGEEKAGGWCRQDW